MFETWNILQPIDSFAIIWNWPSPFSFRNPGSSQKKQPLLAAHSKVCSGWRSQWQIHWKSTALWQWCRLRWKHQLERWLLWIRNRCGLFKLNWNEFEVLAYKDLQSGNLDASKVQLFYNGCKCHMIWGLRCHHLTGGGFSSFRRSFRSETLEWRLGRAWGRAWNWPRI